MFFGFLFVTVSKEIGENVGDEENPETKLF
jgi:hypothetical protein